MKHVAVHVVCPVALVAPHAGAWIETFKRPAEHDWAQSPPTRGRGLKLGSGSGGGTSAKVAPHAGAWIETQTGEDLRRPA